MEKDHAIDVANLDVPHRRALEDVIGRELASSQRLIISVIEVDVTYDESTAAQTIDDWKQVYEGLSDREIQAIDEIVRLRADLTRDLPLLDRKGDPR